MTGRTGNASNLTGEDLHLHFELRNVMDPGDGLLGRIDPARLYGRAPIDITFFDPQRETVSVAGWPGLRVRGINIPAGGRP
jgi:hypothetical protein